MTGRLQHLTRTLTATIIIAMVSTIIMSPIARADSNTGSDGVDIGVTGNGGSGLSGTGSIDTSIDAGNDGSSDGTIDAGPGSPSNVDASTGGNTDTAPPDLCGNPQLISPPPPADDPQWGGSDPKTHDVYVFWCTQALGGGLVPVSHTVVTGRGDPPVPPPPDPADLAMQVWDHMQTIIPVPDPTTSPDFRTAINPDLHVPTTWVNLWNWVWAGADVWHPITESLSVRGVSVTVTADPVGLRLDPGDGGADVSCVNAPGIPYYPPADNVADPSRDPAALGGCGWKYLAASSLRDLLQARLFIDWRGSWTANTGQAGDLGELTTFRDIEPFVVAERRVVIVPNNRATGGGR